MTLAGRSVLLLFMRRVKEAEMLARFGQEYVAHPQRTLFLLAFLLAYRKSSTTNVG